MTPGAIRLIAALRDDAFEAGAARPGKERLAVAFDVLRETNASGLARADESLQARLPLLLIHRGGKLAELFNTL